MALAGAGVFVLLAAWPYLSSATQILAAGDAPSAAKVKQGVEVMAKREHDAKHGREIKAVATLADGRIFLGNKGGLAVLENGQVTAVDGFPGGEVKALAATGNTLWAVSKDTVWQCTGAAWRKAYQGDEAHSLAVGPDQSIYLGTKQGLKRSRDGVQWEAVDVQMPAALIGKMEREKEKDHDDEDREEKKKEKKK